MNRMSRYYQPVHQTPRTPPSGLPSDEWQALRQDCRERRERPILAIVRRIVSCAVNVATVAVFLTGWLAMAWLTAYFAAAGWSTGGG